MVDFLSPPPAHFPLFSFSETYECGVGQSCGSMITHSLTLDELMEHRGRHKDQCMKHLARQWLKGFC
jgi:hypothetical protein